jgi:hypothetical protein
MRTGGSHRAMRSGRREAAGQFDRLARFSGATLTDPALFGGGSDVASVGLRAQTVAYGYLGVVEEYAHPSTGARWCTLSVTLPNAVPFLGLDHRSALGQPNVPLSGGHFDLIGYPDFDAAYMVTADEPLTVLDLLTPALRSVVLADPVQRLAYTGARLMLRTFNHSAATPELTSWLVSVASAVLAATPGFVSRVMSPDAGPVCMPFPPGLYGPNE